MYLDFKITTWERMVIPDEKKEEVLKKLKEGQIQTADDVLNIEGVTYEGTIIGVDEQMVPSENGGFSTIDFIDKENVEFFTNGK